MMVPLGVNPGRVAADLAVMLAGGGEAIAEGAARASAGETAWLQAADRNGIPDSRAADEGTATR
ncbi:hypothetical protein [Streptomyces sp.]